MNRLLLFFACLVAPLHAVPLVGNTITANGTYTIDTAPGRVYTFAASGTFGGGSLAINWRDQSGNSGAYIQSPATTAENWTFTAATRTVDLILTGATTPAITLTIGEAVGDGAFTTAIDDLEAELDLKASSALQRPNLTRPNQVLYHDTFMGDDETDVVSGTQTMIPGPGTWTVGSASNQSFVRREKGRMRMVLLPYAAAGQIQLNAPATTLAAGMAMRVRFVSSFENTGANYTKTKFGFAHSTTNGPARRGCISIERNINETYPKVWISNGSSNTDDSLSSVGIGVIQPADECEGIIFHKTLQHQEYYLQSPRSGCPVGSDRWHKLGETFMDLTGAGTVYPFVYHEASGVSEIREVTVYSSWTPPTSTALLDFSKYPDLLIGTHISSLGRDPRTDLMVLGWNRGTAHTGPGLTEIRGSVRLASGAWTAPTTWMAAPTSPAGQCINSISKVGNDLWLVYWKSATGTDGGTLYRRTLTIDAGTGAVTLGTETTLGISGSLNLNFSPIITLTGGRLILPYHHGAESSPQYNQHIAYSDDGGTTWGTTLVASSIPAGMVKLVEGSVVEESDGALGIFMRNSSGSTAYARSTNPTASPPVFSTPVGLGGVPNPDSRCIVRKLSSGQIVLIGNDAKLRRNITVWKLGDNGVVQEKIFVADWNPIESSALVSTAILAYPDIIENGQKVGITWTHQDAGSSNLAMGIRFMERTLENPVGIDGGGSGLSTPLREVQAREIAPQPVIIPFGTSPIPDCSKSNRRVKGKHSFVITITASTATLQPPSNIYPWDEVEVMIIQGGAGGFTMPFHSDYQTNGATTTLLTDPGAMNTAVFKNNPYSGKMVLKSFH